MFIIRKILLYKIYENGDIINNEGSLKKVKNCAESTRSNEFLESLGEGGLRRS